MNPILITNTYCKCHGSRRSSVRCFVWLAAGLLLVSAATSCHTARGLGRDVEAAGEGIQQAATPPKR
jgi:predicted small secreted protein